MWENLWPRGACLLLGYALGSVMTAELAARIAAGKSIREIGNGNPGFANVLLHLGKPAGTAVLAGDVLKTAMACWLCTALFPSLKGIAILYAGLGAVLGHDFPPRGQGGKGVTVTCTWLTLCLPVSGALCCLAGGALTLALGVSARGRGFHCCDRRAAGLGAVRQGACSRLAGLCPCDAQPSLPGASACAARHRTTVFRRKGKVRNIPIIPCKTVFFNL